MRLLAHCKRCGALLYYRRYVPEVHTYHLIPNTAKVAGYSDILLTSCSSLTITPCDLHDSLAPQPTTLLHL